MSVGNNGSRTGELRFVHFKLLPMWLNLELGVFLRLYELAQKDQLV